MEVEIKAPARSKVSVMKRCGKFSLKAETAVEQIILAAMSKDWGDPESEMMQAIRQSSKRLLKELESEEA